MDTKFCRTLGKFRLRPVNLYELSGTFSGKPQPNAIEPGNLEKLFSENFALSEVVFSNVVVEEKDYI